MNQARVDGPAEGQHRPSPSSVGFPSNWFNHPVHGPLPALLLLLTVATGVVDAVSILVLGRVFIANMTGNIVFIGLALAGAAGFSLIASLLALVGFLVGAAVCAPAISRWRAARGRLLAVVTTAELLLLAGALAIAAAATEPFPGTSQNLIAFVAPIALGLQNAAARELAVPDATTTVLTMTLTGFAADLRQRNGQVLLRRLLAVAAMLVGEVAGAASGRDLGAGAVPHTGRHGVPRGVGAWYAPRPLADPGNWVGDVTAQQWAGVHE
jgi:uncharacterized membrane protein YoaK (UPF0700 family)